MEVKLYSDQEIEEMRQEQLAKEDKERTDPDDPQLDDSDWRERFKPGTFGCHEALQMASVFQDMVSSHLLDHPAVLMDEQAYRLAYKAQEYLYHTYQRLGEVHIHDAEDGEAV